jgi:uncharacterized protein YidB (DUF937 family)
MGLLDSIGSLAGDASQGDSAKVMGGFIQALQSHPEGIQGMLKSFTANGLGDHATALANGETPSVTTDEVKQGLGGTGLIEKAAQHAGVSPAVVEGALATVLPLVMAHFAKGDGPTAASTSSGGIGDIAQNLIKKFTA